MADLNRKPLLDRMTALLAGPLLLGRQALNLEWGQAAVGGPPEPQVEAPARIAVTPPEHAIKRRG
jgi:hypothetical protein